MGRYIFNRMVGPVTSKSEIASVSCVLLTYNHVRYVKESLEAFLSTGIENTSISVQYIISDDCSSDGTVEFVDSFLQGLEKDRNVVFVKRKTNCGLIAHFNEVLSLVTGEVLLFCAGDDVSFPTRLEVIVRHFENSGVTMVCSDGVIIDEHGHTKSRLFGYKKGETTLKRIFSTGLIGLPGAGFAYRREIFDRFGPLPMDVENEDDQWPVRALLLNGIAIINEPLFYYRTHSQSLSSWAWSPTLTPAMLAERCRSNLENRLSHFLNWRHLVLHSERSESLKMELAILERRINFYTQLVNGVNSWRRLYCVRYMDLFTRDELFIVLFGLRSAAINRSVIRLKLLVKRLIFKLRK